MKISYEQYRDFFQFVTENRDQDETVWAAQVCITAWAANEHVEQHIYNEAVQNMEELGYTV